ncbi:sigma-70 family RNA polymerase sigma factor [Clostridium sp. E02]|uniref:sigma-70 family RNA polymerase sigma factor n=1 Tax=Clostridium sp. E02 TaxID=2487134 RepID=UPI000F5426D2|nr:sigma-70 family RNA polymerase sigma factor [Clostridium sp. E02]
MEPQKRRECLITNNMRLAISVAQKFSYEEDYESVAMIGLIKAADTFDLDKGINFATYATRVIYNEILMYIRKNKRHPQALSIETIIHGTDENPLTIEDTLNYEDEQMMRLEQEEQTIELHKIIHSLPDRECKIICQLYGIGEESHTQKDVAEWLGISQSYVSRLEKKILKKMKLRLRSY